MTETDIKSKYLRKIVARRREKKISPQNMAERSKMNKDYYETLSLKRDATQ